MTSAVSVEAIRQAGVILRQARHAVAFTGAGISTPSGIPDFRSASTGEWSRNDPMRVASLTAFRRTPQVFFDWLRPLADKINQAAPNPAHYALVELEKAGRIKAVITQNIDGLHQRAGSQQVIEVHGCMDTLTCPACHRQYTAAQVQPAFVTRRELPTCTACNCVLKPDFTLFEEMLPGEAWNAALKHCETADVVLVVGSSLNVSPAANLPGLVVQNGGKAIINTLSPTYLDHAALCLPGDVAEIMPLLAQAAQ